MRRRFLAVSFTSAAAQSRQRRQSGVGVCSRTPGRACGRTAGDREQHEGYSAADRNDSNDERVWPESIFFVQHPPTADRITLMEKHIKTVISTRAKGCASSIEGTRGLSPHFPRPAGAARKIFTSRRTRMRVWFPEGFRECSLDLFLSDARKLEICPHRSGSAGNGGTHNLAPEPASNQTTSSKSNSSSDI